MDFLKETAWGTVDVATLSKDFWIVLSILKTIEKVVNAFTSKGF